MKYDLPWQRVINSKGGISLTGEAGFLQGERLTNEGVLVKDKQISLKEFQYFLD
jgi:methylated-DNA-protein-cysteine methyltransferase-like protein